MRERYTYELMEDPKELEKFECFSEETYRDLLACQKGDIKEDEFRSKYRTTAAILCLDMTGLTRAAMEGGGLYSLFRILDVQKVCGPIFHKFNARKVRAFADDFFVLFDDPEDALLAAFEVHHRIQLFNQSELASENPALCCIGIGYGEVYAIGVDHAMGDEMNRASKLGEDIARAAETLITERVYEELKDRNDCTFRKRNHEEIPFPFYEVFSNKEKSI